MHVAAPFGLKRRAEAEAGELIEFRRMGVVLAIVLERQEQKSAYGFLRGDRVGLPFWIEIDNREAGYCLSFGVDWEIELFRSPETYSGNPNFHEIPGVVHITEERVLITFGPTPQTGNSAANVDLRTWKFATIENHAAPILDWKIWRMRGLSPEEKAQEGPIMAFQAPRPARPESAG